MSLIADLERRKPLSASRLRQYHRSREMKQRLIVDPVYRWFCWEEYTGSRYTRKTMSLIARREYLENVNLLTDKVFKMLHQSETIEVPISINEISEVVNSQTLPKSIQIPNKQFEESKAIALFEIEQESRRRGVTLDENQKNQIANVLSWLALRVSEAVP